MQNQPLELASLFIYTRRQIEHVADSNQHSPSTSSLHGGPSSRQSQQLTTSSGFGAAMSSQADLSGPTGAIPKGKHKQFKLTVYGLNGDDDENDNGVQVKVTQETTVQQVIEQVKQFLLIS